MLKYRCVKPLVTLEGVSVEAGTSWLLDIHHKHTNTQDNCMYRLLKVSNILVDDSVDITEQQLKEHFVIVMRRIRRRGLQNEKT